MRLYVDSRSYDGTTVHPYGSYTDIHPYGRYTDKTLRR